MTVISKSEIRSNEPDSHFRILHNYVIITRKPALLSRDKKIINSWFQENGIKKIIAGMAVLSFLGEYWRYILLYISFKAVQNDVSMPFGDWKFDI